MRKIVIATYKPKPGKRDALKVLMQTHITKLRNEGLVTDRPSIIMEAADGTIVEVFEWLSAEAIAQAHTNHTVLQMWQEYAEVCEYIPLNSLAETGQLFAEFMPLN